MDDGQQFYEEQRGISTGFDIENRLRDMLDIPGINNLNENASSREIFVRKISELFLNLLNTEKQKVARQFQEQYALLEEYCDNLQQEKMDLTFHQEKQQKKEKEKDYLRNGFTQIQNNITEESTESKQQPQTMAMLELQRMQKYCSELEAMLEEANQAASTRYSENLALQAFSEDQNGEIQQLRDKLLGFEMKLNTERESNKSFMLSTVAKYKHKISIYKQKIKEVQQNHELHKEEFHKYQLLENEEKNGYQKQILQIQSQIEQVVQHYEEIIAKMKGKTKDELGKITSQFEQDVKLRELQEKQRTTEMEERIKRQLNEQYEKEMHELKDQLMRITGRLESNLKMVEDYEIGQKNFEREIERLTKEKKDMGIALQELNKQNQSLLEQCNEANKKQEKHIRDLKMTEDALSEEDTETVEMNEQLIKKNDNLATKIEEISLINTQLLKRIEERKRTIDGLQNILEEKGSQEEKWLKKDLESQAVLLKIKQENEELKQRQRNNQNIMKNVKGQLVKVLTDLAEVKNRLAITQKQLTEKMIILKDWAISSIATIQENNNSQNDKNAGNQKLLERITNLERESAEKEEIIVRLREIQKKAIETQDECRELRIRLSGLTQEIHEKKAWEEDERVKILKEKNKQLRENERLLHENGVLSAEVAKLKVQTQRLAEENNKFNYDLQVKKEKTKLKSRKDTQNIAEIKQIIQQSVQTLQNSHALTLQNLIQNTKNDSINHSSKGQDSQFNQIHSHTPVCSSSPQQIKANQLDTSHINSVQPQLLLNNNFTPSNSLSTSQVYSYHIPYSSSKSSTPVQNSSFIKRSMLSSRSQIRFINNDNLTNQESLAKTLQNKLNQGNFPQFAYSAAQNEVTPLRIKQDHQRIINNLSKLQQLDRFLQRSRSNSNIQSQQKQNNPDHPLNQPIQQIPCSNPTTIQIPSSHGPLSERTDEMFIHNNNQQNHSQQPSPAQLRRSQSFNFPSKNS